MNDNFHDYLFHYNVYEKLWYVFTRDDSNNYFNDRASIKTLSAPDIKILIKAIAEGVTIE
jgi:hypothetical protein